MKNPGVGPLKRENDEEIREEPIKNKTESGEQLIKPAGRAVGGTDQENNAGFGASAERRKAAGES